MTELVDDERTLARHADALAAAVVNALGPWVTRCVRSVADREQIAIDHVAASAVARAAEECRTDIGARVRELLAADIDDQHCGPLQILRNAVSYPTAVLSRLGVPPARRDRFAAEAFPEDIYDLSPASFADVDPALHEPGIVWGAAKAHVHLRRRREEVAR